MQKIKVLHVVEALGGGVYSYFIDLSKFLGEDSRIEATLVYSNKRPEVIPEMIRKDIHSNVNLVLLDFTKEINPRSDFESTIQLKKLFSELNPAIIHLHSSKISVIGRVAYLLSKTNASLYYTPHGYAFLRKDISKLQRIVYYTIERIAAKLSGITIACGDTEYSIANKFGKAILVRNGVNLTTMQPKIDIKKENSHQKIIIGILGRITSARNPKLFNKIANHFPEINFLWIGDGELRKEITAPNIEITGWFNSKQEGFKYLNQLDVYIQTSLWEGLPIAILEAMAFEKPVVATNIIGNKDAVVHEETGFLFDTFDEGVKYIQQLLDDEDLRKKMGKNGYERCKELFDSKKNFNELIELYHSHLSN